MSTVISVSGFYNTGSSAIVDLLMEYKGVSSALSKNQKGKTRPYEHKLFTMDNSLFYLCERLSGMNSFLVCDNAINEFVDYYKRMYEQEFVSFGSYKKLLGKQFWDSVETFLKDIGATCSDKNTNCEHKKRVRFSLIVCLLQLGAKICFKYPVYKWGKRNIRDKRPVYFAMPDDETLQRAAKGFTSRYFDMCNDKDAKVNIYDQLFYARQIPYIGKYCNRDVKAIFAVRDPRDVFFGDKYVGGFGLKAHSILPRDPEAFCDMWSKNIYIPEFKDENIMIVQFEDLVYKYEETKKRIEEFCGLSPEDHINPKKFFDPDKSIKNTQAFRVSEQGMSEAKIIGERLPHLCYDFPFENKTSLGEMFEDSY